MNISSKSVDLPTLSVVICTYQRRELVIDCVRSLDAQSEELQQIVVVVDGSTDGTSGALKDLDTKAPLQIITHENIGAAASRNVGAPLADSDIIYFLDDDMELVSGSLRARRERHQNGARVVMGAVPLHPDSPKTILAANVGRWASEMADRFDGRDDVPWTDCFMGNTSLEAELFFECQGMRTEFNARGKWGNSDTELAYRLNEKGIPLSFSREAAAMQKFVVPPKRHINRYHDLGRADIHLIRLHPHLKNLKGDTPFSGYSTVPQRLKPLVQRFPGVIELFARPAFHLLTLIISFGVHRPILNRLAWAFCEIYYFKGVNEALRDEACMD